MGSQDSDANRPPFRGTRAFDPVSELSQGRYGRQRLLKLNRIRRVPHHRIDIVHVRRKVCMPWAELRARSPIDDEQRRGLCRREPNRLRRDDQGPRDNLVHEV